MDESEDELQLEQLRTPSNNRWEDMTVLVRNSEQLMDRINSRLEDLNTALDHLEERTDRVIGELRQLTGTENQQRRAHDGCGDPGADE